jgi:hypothetical protein
VPDEGFLDGNGIHAHFGVGGVVLRCAIGLLPLLVAHEGEVHYHRLRPFILLRLEIAGWGNHRVRVDYPRIADGYADIRPIPVSDWRTQV